MTRAILLWLGFIAVHLAIAAQGFIYPAASMGDVSFVYDPWSARALAGEGIVGVDEPWVYPQLALLPMMAAQALAAVVGDYEVAWAVLVTILNAIGFAVLVGNGASRGRVAAAAFWLAAIAVIGPVGIYRIDAITVPLAIVALLLLVRRPAVAGTLLAIATWIKVWPAALIAAAFVVVRRRLAILVSGLVVTLVVAAGVLALGGGRNLLGFLTEQGARGMQVEAPLSTPLVWAAMLGVDGAEVRYSDEILTYQVWGPGEGVLAALSTPLLVLAFVVLAAIGVIGVRRGAATRRILPPLALALVVSLMVFNKVGSPQFHVWLIAPIVLWLVLDRYRATPAAVLVLACGAMTQLIYPLYYGAVLGAQPWAVMLLTTRNIALVALLALAVLDLVLGVIRAGRPADPAPIVPRPAAARRRRRAITPDPS